MGSEVLKVARQTDLDGGPGKLLDKLTNEGVVMASSQVLKITHDVRDDDVRAFDMTAVNLNEKVQRIVDGAQVCSISHRSPAPSITSTIKTAKKQAGRLIVQ